MDHEPTPVQLYTPHCTTPIVDIHGHPTECGWKWNGPPLEEDSAEFELANHFYLAHKTLSMYQCNGYVEPM